MPKLGDKKPCILPNCDGTMERKRIRPPDAFPSAPGAMHPEPTPVYEAWVCDTCGFEQKGAE